MVRDRIVVGLKDETLSEKLQLEADLTLEKEVNQTRQKELVQQQQGTIREEGPSASNVDRVKSARPRPKINSKLVVKLKIETRHVDVAVVNHIKEMTAQQKIPFCSSCKRKGHCKKCCKTTTVSEI